MLDLNLFLVRSDRMEAKLRESDHDLQNIQAVLTQNEENLKTRTEERDIRQAEIQDLDEKIASAHTALMEGMEAVHRAENASREVEERRARRQEDRLRIGEELKDAEERIAELDALASESSGGTETRSASLEKLTARLEAAKAAE